MSHSVGARTDSSDSDDDDDDGNVSLGGLGGVLAERMRTAKSYLWLIQFKAKLR